MRSDDAMTEAYPVRRMEVFTGAGRRRRWSAEAKAQIVAESYSGLETVCAVARRHGLAPTQVFTWRREARTPGGRSRSCPTAWCNCGGVVTAFSGGAGLIRRPRRAG